MVGEGYEGLLSMASPTKYVIDRTTMLLKQETNGHAMNDDHRQAVGGDGDEDAPEVVEETSDDSAESAGETANDSNRKDRIEYARNLRLLFTMPEMLKPDGSGSIRQRCVSEWLTLLLLINADTNPLFSFFFLFFFWYVVTLNQKR